MNMKRRDVLKLFGGSAVGLLLSPVPWKLLDDSAIWTQNWPWIPTPIKGNIQTKYSACTLCPAGCAVRAKCVGDQPVSLWGVKEHPLTHGVLCPAGFAGHHLPYHPLRLKQPCMRSGNGDLTPVALDQVINAIATALSTKRENESLAILDEQPGRTISLLYRQFLSSLPNGVYLRSVQSEGATLNALSEMIEDSSRLLGFDFENAKTILSFGAPLLDGWGTPGRLLHLKRNGFEIGSDQRAKIIQIETRQSPTALQADEWVPIKPGTEATLALGLAHIMVNERLCEFESIRRNARDFDTPQGQSYLDLISHFTPEKVGNITGLSPDKLRDLAHLITKRKPAMVVGDGDPGGGPLGNSEEMAIAGLNLLLGNVGTEGGIISRRELPAPDFVDDQAIAPVMTIDSVPDESIRVLILDAAFSGCATPWPVIQKKLVPEGAIVVSLSPCLSGNAEHAHYFVPAPAYLETHQDLPNTFDARHASLTLSTPLLSPPENATEPVAFLRRLASAANLAFSDDGRDWVKYLKARVDAIQQTGRGRVFVYESGDYVDTAALSSSDELWDLLANGGCWIDSEFEHKPVGAFSFLGKSNDSFDRLLALREGRQAETDREFPLLLMPFGSRSATDNGHVSPVLSKLYQESDLRLSGNHALIHPDTAQTAGVREGDQALVSTPYGSAQIRVKLDAAVMPGIIHLAVGPDSHQLGKGSSILSICTTENETWRMTPARLERGNWS